MLHVHENATYAWYAVLRLITDHGGNISPRGQSTLEIPHNSIAFDMNYPAVICPERKLNYSFMAAEALWILTGDDKVETISKYCKNIAQFSDDGETFFGAYGPRYCDQFKYVVDKLLEDNHTRQATLTLWQQKPPKTKDVPCTIAMSFMIRNGKLNCHVYMRSSDAWLGVPYDFFNFSMMAAEIVANYNEKFLNLVDDHVDSSEYEIELGNLYWTAASSHLYERNFTAAIEILTSGTTEEDQCSLTSLASKKDWEELVSRLYMVRDKLITMSEAIGGFTDETQH